MGIKECKERYFDRVYREAPLIRCACGCEGELKSKDRYGRNQSYINGHNGRKYTDPRQYKREWNHRNRKYRYEQKTSRRRKKRLEIIHLMGDKCTKCGMQYDGTNGAIFQAHHKDPKKKVNCVFTMLNYAGWDKILKEIKKCVLVCANCHWITHSGTY